MDLKFSSADSDDDDDFDEEDIGNFGILKSFQVLVLKFETLLDWRWKSDSALRKKFSGRLGFQITEIIEDFNLSKKKRC